MISNHTSKKNSDIPPGCNRYFATLSGGVASLNHRLITVVPPGQIAVDDSCRDWPEQSVDTQIHDIFTHPDRDISN